MLRTQSLCFAKGIEEEDLQCIPKDDILMSIQDHLLKGSSTLSSGSESEFDQGSGTHPGQLGGRYR